MLQAAEQQGGVLIYLYSGVRRGRAGPHSIFASMMGIFRRNITHKWWRYDSHEPMRQDSCCASAVVPGSIQAYNTWWPRQATRQRWTCPSQCMRWLPETSVDLEATLPTVDPAVSMHSSAMMTRCPRALACSIPAFCSSLPLPCTALDAGCTPVHQVTEPQAGQCHQAGQPSPLHSVAPVPPLAQGSLTCGAGLHRCMGALATPGPEGLCLTTFGWHLQSLQGCCLQATVQLSG